MSLDKSLIGCTLFSVTFRRYNNFETFKRGTAILLFFFCQNSAKLMANNYRFSCSKCSFHAKAKMSIAIGFSKGKRTMSSFLVLSDFSQTQQCKSKSSWVDPHSIHPQLKQLMIVQFLDCNHVTRRPCWWSIQKKFSAKFASK